MTPTRLEVSTAGGRHYPIEIGDGLIARLGAVLDRHGVGRRRIVVSTPPVWRLVAADLEPVAGPHGPVLIPDGERVKHLATVGRIYEALVRLGADRGSTIVAVGGGVVGDVAGFAAATFLRGLDLVQVPTTLLAQVDAAIGGKVGVNHPAGKNLIGAFHPPRAVVIDPEVLATLPRREFRAGLYEVVKYGVIASRELFETVRRDLRAVFAREPSVLQPLIAACCGIKARIVSEDERERGPRRVLNFGHTAGHALEAITRYRRFRHGEAVAYGMLAAAAIARARGQLAEAAADELAALLTELGPRPPVADLSARDALDAMRHDKKIVDGQLHLVLPVEIGRTAIVTDVTPAEMEQALRAVGLGP